MVYVLSKDGKPLMPTTRFGKVRRMLKNGEAKVIKRTPFTIQLTYETTTYVQEVSLGVDAGTKHIGLSEVRGILHDVSRTRMALPQLQPTYDPDTCAYCGADLVLPPAQENSPCALPEYPHCPRGCGPEDDYVPRWPVQIYHFKEVKAWLGNLPSR